MAISEGIGWTNTNAAWFSRYDRAGLKLSAIASEYNQTD
jgi:hypothetical protein